MLILICGDDSHFADDIADRCTLCRGQIFFRPYLINIVFRLCSTCGLKYVNEHGTPENIETPSASYPELAEKFKFIH